MQESVTVWSVLEPFLRLFSTIGNDWIAGSQDVPGYGNNPFPYGEPTPVVSAVFSEVKTGWSLTTIFDLWGPLFFLVAFVSLLLGIVVVYCSMRILQVRRIERAALRAYASPIAAMDTPKMHLRWNRIMEQAMSDDAQHWRLAILECDLLLNELLDLLGYKGETMSDKMKQVDIAAFNTIDFAWEAHQVRNAIAHDPSYTLDAREVRRVVKMYERVFKEFKFID